MTSLSQDSNNDIFATDGLLSVSSSKEAMGFIIADAIRTLEGELQLDTESGIPYARTIWVSDSKLNIWKYYVRKKIESFDFVESIDSFDVSIDGRNLYYKIVVSTDDGSVTVES